MILFKKVRWKNLLSTGNIFTEIDLTKYNSTLIVGTNGSGKSTILDAISFALYNKPFRKINKPQLINSINGKIL
jgi:DNA repair exonuclease SbcCD ATPase subunit